MQNNLRGFPVLVKLSALSLGVPLLLFGIALVALDILGQMRILASTVEPLSGIAFGPVFALVGASFLYPLIALGAQPKASRRRL